MKKDIYNELVNLNLSMDRLDIKKFSFILEKGILIKIKKKYTLRNFIYNKLNFNQDYLEKNIKTIFFNGSVVDNIDSIVVVNGCSISFSAAMPGLVGAAFSKKSKYALFRKKISFNSEKQIKNNKGAYVVVKMFNLISRDYAEFFLNKGILIPATSFVRIIKNFIELKDEYSININGCEVVPEKINFELFGNKLIFITVKIFTDKS